MFTSSGAGRTRRAEFVLPPTAGTSAMYGERIEDVRFLRDEMANMVWAIEHTVEGGLGQPLEGYERSARRAAKPPQPALPIDPAHPPAAVPAANDGTGELDSLPAGAARSGTRRHRPRARSNAR